MTNGSGNRDAEIITDNQYLHPQNLFLTIAALEDAVDKGKYRGRAEGECPVCASKLTWKTGDRSDEAVFTCHGDASAQHRSLIRAEVKSRLKLTTLAGKAATNGSKRPRKAPIRDKEEYERASNAAFLSQETLDQQLLSTVRECIDDGKTWEQTYRTCKATFEKLGLADDWAYYQRDLATAWELETGEVPSTLSLRSSARDVADLFALEYDKTACYVDELASWYWYERHQQGVWSAISADALQRKIKIWMSRKQIEYSASMLSQIAFLVRLELLRDMDEFQADPKLIAFTNGVYNLETDEWFEHSPDHCLQWGLDRPYMDIEADWSPIKRWMDGALGDDAEMIERAICTLAAILRGWQPLGEQRYAELIGQSGGGKGTFIRLAQRLIGMNNVLPLTLHALETRPFALQGLEQGKRLCLFSDEPIYRGDVGLFLSLTGGDTVPIDRKNKDILAYRFTGWTIVAGTQSVFGSRNASKGIDRRRLPITGWRKDDELKSVEQEFTEPVIVAFTHYLLSISEDRLQAALGRVALPIEIEVESDALTAWFDDCLILEPRARVQLGSNSRDDYTLFGNYCRYCRATEVSNRSYQAFSRDFKDLLARLERERGWDIQVARPQNKITYIGLRLRDEDRDFGSPNLISG